MLLGSNLVDTAGAFTHRKFDHGLHPRFRARHLYQLRARRQYSPGRGGGWLGDEAARLVAGAHPAEDWTRRGLFYLARQQTGWKCRVRRYSVPGLWQERNYI